MSQIKKIELYYVEIPLAKTLSPAWYRGYQQNSERMTLLRLTTDDGHEGISAVACMGEEWSGIGAWLNELFLGCDVQDSQFIQRKIKESAFVGCPIGWVEAAFWDLLGKIEQKPVYALLSSSGEVVENIPVYASTLENLSVEERLESFKEITKAGFQGAKLRATGDFSIDLQMIEEVRGLVGDEFALMIDANQGRRIWKGKKEPKLWKLAQAMDFAVAAAPFRIEWLEEPLDMHAYDDLSVLRGESEIPIAGGQLNAGWHEFKLFIEKRSLDFYQPNALAGGGVSCVQQLMDAIMRRDNLYFTPNSGSTGISFLINLHMYAAWSRRFFYECPFEPGKYTLEQMNTLFSEPVELLGDGTVKVPQTPGFGIHLDQARFEKYAKLWYTSPS